MGRKWRVDGGYGGDSGLRESATSFTVEVFPLMDSSISLEIGREYFRDGSWSSRGLVFWIIRGLTSSIPRDRVDLYSPTPHDVATLCKLVLLHSIGHSRPRMINLLDVALPQQR